jgi:hypothetical protein
MEDKSRAMAALRDLAESTSDNPLLFSSWLNAIIDLPEDFLQTKSEIFRLVRDIIETNMQAGMYRFFSEELQPSEEEIKTWLIACNAQK